MSSTWDPAGVARQFSDPGEWDRCKLGGEWLPGIARVKVKKGRAVKQHEQVGGNVRTTFLAYHPASVDIELVMWTDMHITELVRVLKIIEPVKSKAPSPVDVYHPATYMRGVKSVFVMEVEGPEPAGEGLWNLRLRCAEWWPETKGKQKPVTPTGSTGQTLAEQFVGRQALVQGGQQQASAVRVGQSHGSPQVTTSGTHGKPVSAQVAVAQAQVPPSFDETEP